MRRDPPSSAFVLSAIVVAMALGACAKVQPTSTDFPIVDGGRERDLAGADLLQVEQHDLGLCGSCDDGIACTTDVCLPTVTCDHVPDHGKCADRQLCTATGCVPIESAKLCAICTTDPDCGVDELCTAMQNGDMGTAQVCLARCGAGGSCPKGFSCDLSRSRCVPTSGAACCYDGDGDQRGIGVGCLGVDCDDADPQVYAGHAEVCDGKDNDCNGQKDEGFLCGGPTCGPIGTTGSFSGIAIPACTAGACVVPSPGACGRYTCHDVTAPLVGSVCGTSCSGSNDAACIAGAYCDGSGCAAQLTNGAVCSRDRMCQAGHCQNGHCCASGDCCAQAGDCPAGAYSTPPVCDMPFASCQGHREDRSCTSQKICAKTKVDDDSACGASISISCNPLSPQSCSGAVAQSALACPTTCANDGECVPAAYCSGGTCVARKPDGSGCGADNQCATGHHCLNGFCCNASTGACCGGAGDCPATYAAPATCDSPLTSCQGHRVDKTCIASVCGSQNTDDDGACSSAISKTCGAYTPVSCNGLGTQAPLTCAVTCVSDSECVTPANHCLGGVCKPWIENGGACTAANQCRTGFCVGSVCCQAACNGTSCDTCGGGSCMPFLDPLENGNACLASLPDLGAGAFTASLQAYLQGSTDDEDWYQMYATDSSVNGCGGFIHVQLSVPAGVDYDVYLYSTPDGSCGGATFLAAGLAASGDEDVRWTERCSISDEGWYLVRVKRYAGASCTLPYTLSVDVRL